MEPALGVGDVLVAEPYDGRPLPTGAVIVFENPAGPGLVSHRLLSINDDGTLVTKGDANRQPDSTPVTPDAVVGVGRIVVPLIGRPTLWAASGGVAAGLAAALVLALALWAARWGMLRRFDPWRSVPSATSDRDPSDSTAEVANPRPHPDIDPRDQWPRPRVDAPNRSGSAPFEPVLPRDDRAHVIDHDVRDSVDTRHAVAPIVGPFAMFSDEPHRFVVISTSVMVGCLILARLLGVPRRRRTSRWVAAIWRTPLVRTDRRQVILDPVAESGSSVWAKLVALAAPFVLVGVVTLPVANATLTTSTPNASNSFVADVWVEVIGLDAGLGHACLVRELGSVWCWGLNDKGQLGENTTTDRWTPKQVKGSGGTGQLTGVASIGSGPRHNCAAKGDGSVWCWGLNNEGQLGDNTTTDRPAPVQVKGPGGVGTLTGASAVTAGVEHACVVKSDGSVWCWGRNDKGQLGDNTTTDRLAPVQVKGPGGAGTLTGAVTIAAGGSSTCAVKTDASVWCWGLNNKGQLGDDTTTDRASPVQVKGPGGVGTLPGVALAAVGEQHACVVKTDGSMWCWGLNNKGQLGDTTTTDRASPVQVTGPGGAGTLSGTTSPTAGLQHNCAVRSDGSVWCWGLNDKGQLGDNTTTDRASPVQVKGPGGVGTLPGVVLAAGGDLFTCAAASDHTVWCWGRNDKGQLGDNTTTDRPVPVQVKGGGWTGAFDAVAVTGGGTHSCALRPDGSAWCWGRNDKGQLGDNTTTSRIVPGQVTGAGGVGALTGVSALTAGLKHSCAVRTTGSAWCWGLNDKGQLGDNTTTDRSAPVQVKGPGGVGTLSGAVAVAAGESSTCAVKSDGSVWCWGRNDKGQLGDNTTIDRSAPVQVKGASGVGTLTGASTVTTGPKHSCAAAAGSVWCWGLNDKGQLGDNTTIDRPVPVQVKGLGGVGTLSGAVAVAAGESSTCAVKSDGSVWCWGRNDKGQLGDNTTIDQLAPVQVKGPGGVGTLAAATTLTAGLKHVCVLKSDGTLWCWGINDKGELGDNTTTNRPVPVQVAGPSGVGTLTAVAVTDAGDEFTCAVSGDHTTWCWGRNGDGQLGDGTNSDKSAPSQVM